MSVKITNINYNYSSNSKKKIKGYYKNKNVIDIYPINEKDNKIIIRLHYKNFIEKEMFITDFSILQDEYGDSIELTLKNYNQRFYNDNTIYRPNYNIY